MRRPTEADRLRIAELKDLVNEMDRHNRREAMRVRDFRHRIEELEEWMDDLDADLIAAVAGSVGLKH